MDEEPIQAQKPPLGVTPENIHRLLRFKDLARAIHEYCEAGLRPDHRWVDELFRTYPITFNKP